MKGTLTTAEIELLNSTIEITEENTGGLVYLGLGSDIAIVCGVSRQAPSLTLARLEQKFEFQGYGEAIQFAIRKKVVELNRWQNAHGTGKQTIERLVSESPWINGIKMSTTTLEALAVIEEVVVPALGYFRGYLNEASRLSTRFEAYRLQDQLGLAKKYFNTENHMLALNCARQMARYEGCLNLHEYASKLKGLELDRASQMG